MNPDQLALSMALAAAAGAVARVLLDLLKLAPGWDALPAWQRKLTVTLITVAAGALTAYGTGEAASPAAAVLEAIAGAGVALGTAVGGHRISRRSDEVRDERSRGGEP